jgi:hypothetical protein
MSASTITRSDRWRRWWVLLLLVLLLAAISAGAFFATHPDALGATHTASSTATPSVPATGDTVLMGGISYPPNKVSQVQQAAKRGNTRFSYYLDPRQVVRRDLPLYGFKGGFTIISPPPRPVATPYTNSAGQPEIQFVVKYQGQKYQIILNQLAQQGAKGIWLITAINVLQAA